MGEFGPWFKANWEFLGSHAAEERSVFQPGKDLFSTCRLPGSWTPQGVGGAREAMNWTAPSLPVALSALLVEALGKGGTAVCLSQSGLNI